MLALSQAGWVAIGGIATAFVGGAFTFAGVIVNALSQRKPEKVVPDPDPCAQCRADLLAMTEDRDRWRAVAETFMPRRRTDDDPPTDRASSDGGPDG